MNNKGGGGASEKRGKVVKRGLGRGNNRAAKQVIVVIWGEKWGKTAKLREKGYQKGERQENEGKNTKKTGNFWVRIKTIVKKEQNKKLKYGR